MTQGRGQIPSACDLLITGGTVLTMDESRSVVDPGAVAVEADRIISVGPAAEFAHTWARRTVEAAGMVVIPGFVDCHTHTYQSLGRSLGDGLGLWPWLRGFMWPLAAAMTDDDTRVAAYLSAAQAVRGGTTTILDHHAPNNFGSVLAVAAAIEEVGLRGVVGRSIRGPRTGYGQQVGVTDKFWRTLEEELEITRACLEARPNGGRVVVWPAPANVVHVGQDALKQAVALAHEFGTGWHTHCSEDPTDPDVYLETHGVRPVEWLYREELLGPDATLAHSIWLDEREIEHIGETETGVSYNPTSNAYVGCGVMPLRALRNAGARVGLGTDGLSVAGPNMFRCMEQAVLIQRIAATHPTTSNAEEALELATRGGARYLGIEAGELAQGKLADIAIVDLNRLELQPVGNPAETLVYHAQQADVSMTIVSGTIVYEAGHCVFVDEAELLLEVRERADSVIARAGLERLLPGRRETSEMPA